MGEATATPVRTNAPYSPAEDAVIRDLWPTLEGPIRARCRAIAQYLDRSYKSIRDRCYRLGIVQPQVSLGLGDNVTPHEDDPEPCPHPPGSEAKIEWLARRVEQGYRLWREGDAPGEGHTAPPLQVNGRVRKGVPDESNRLRSVRVPRVRRVIGNERGRR